MGDAPDDTGEPAGQGRRTLIRTMSSESRSRTVSTIFKEDINRAWASKASSLSGGIGRIDQGRCAALGQGEEPGRASRDADYEMATTPRARPADGPSVTKISCWTGD